MRVLVAISDIVVLHRTCLIARNSPAALRYELLGALVDIRLSGSDLILRYSLAYPSLV